MTAQSSARSMSAAEVVQALGTLDALRRSGALTEVVVDEHEAVVVGGTGCRGEQICDVVTMPPP